MSGDQSFDSGGLYDQARGLMDQGRLEEAVLLFEESNKSFPHFKTLELLGECNFRLGKLSEAIVPLAAATTLNRGVRAPSLLAEVFLKLGEFHNAEEITAIALSRDATNRRALRVKDSIDKANAG